MSEGPHPTVTSPVHHRHHHHHPTSPEYHQPMSMHPEQPLSPADGQPRDPPPGAYGPPPYGGYHYPPYGPPAYGPPASGYYNYPPPPPPPPPHYNGGGYGPPPAHYYGYGYPSQHSSKPPSDAKRRKSPSRRAEKDKKSPISSQLAEDIELERMRAAAEPVQVKPMRSDFHFFVDDMRDNIQAISEKELGEDANNKFLLFTNMNARLMKAWEDATDETRAAYLVKEEEDRRRFMAEDEIASRHCATLTARARSPRGKDGEDCDDDDEDEDDDEDDEVKKRSPQKSLESPPKKSKPDDDHADGAGNHSTEI